MVVMGAGLALAGDAQNGIGTGVEQPDRRVHGPVEQVQGDGCPQRQQLGFTDGPGLGRQLADHNVQVGNHKKGAEERDGLDHFVRLHAYRFEHRFQQVCERGFTDPTQAERCQGDTQLAGRQIGVQLAVHSAQDLATPAVLFGDRLDAGRAQFDHGELGGYEKAVEQHQQ
ncbi:hypothetical protein D3C80_1124720 [compost metagenome]